MVVCTKRSASRICSEWAQDARRGRMQSIGQCANLFRVALVQSIPPCPRAMVCGDTRRVLAAYDTLLARHDVREGLG